MKLPHHFGVLLLVYLCSTGCAGVHLHHDGNFTLAKQAQATFEEADLTGSIGEERNLLKKMLQSELAVVNRHDQALRDAPLVTMLNATIEDRDKPFHWPRYLSERLEKRQQRLVGGDALALQVLEIQIDEQRIGMARVKDKYLATPPAKNDPVATCPLPEEIPSEFSSDIAQITFGHFQQACSKLGTLLDQRQKLLVNSSGLVGQLAEKIAQNQNDQEQSRRELAALSNAYKKAKKAYQAAVKAGEPADLATAAEELKNKLGAWLDRAKEIGQSKPLQLDSLIGALDGVQESLNQVLDAIISVNKEVSDSLQHEPKGSLRVLAVLPSIAAQLDDSLNPPNVSSLLLEAEHLRLQRELAQRRLANARLQLELRDRKYQAIVTEVGLLWESQGAVKRFGDKKHPKTGEPLCPRGDGPLVTVFEASTTACKAEIAQALLSYANSYDVGRALQHAFDRRLIGAQHDAALDSSEIALAQWNNLIGVPLSQLVAFHSAGIKPEDIGNLVQALGLGAVASNLD